MDSPASGFSADMLFRTSGLGRCELVRGEIVMMTPAGMEHGWVSNRIATRLSLFAERRSLGIVVVSGAGFQIGREPDTVRAPDAAFIRAHRLAGGIVRGYFQGAPDLVVEVQSPNDRPVELAGKTAEWLAAGAVVVWVVDPASQSIMVHRGGCEPVRLEVGDDLRADDVLPGFVLPVAEVFGLRG